MVIRKVDCCWSIMLLLLSVLRQSPHHLHHCLNLGRWLALVWPLLCIQLVKAHRTLLPCDTSSLLAWVPAEVRLRWGFEWFIGELIPGSSCKEAERWDRERKGANICYVLMPGCYLWAPEVQSCQATLGSSVEHVSELFQSKARHQGCFVHSLWSATVQGLWPSSQHGVGTNIWVLKEWSQLCLLHWAGNPLRPGLSSIHTGSWCPPGSSMNGSKWENPLGLKDVCALPPVHLAFCGLTTISKSLSCLSEVCEWLRRKAGRRCLPGWAPAAWAVQSPCQRSGPRMMEEHGKLLHPPVLGCQVTAICVFQVPWKLSPWKLKKWAEKQDPDEQWGGIIHHENPAPLA